ncbi:MAG: serine hydroxymethyltransferase [Alphaproteobacteria bacterium]|nr:serine hydroxymethyltransferase [Alphaproteobacteria bacterium]
MAQNLMVDIANKKIDFFQSKLGQSDPDIAFFLKKELERQQNQIELIASENIVSTAVMEALGTVPTNKYAEGYPGKRYYGGCEYVDEIESIAIERAKLLFDCDFANVQPHSGSQANFAVYFALLNPGDTILGMSLNEGGHLTHGSAPSFSGKWFNAVQYGLSKDTHLIDYDNVESLAKKHKPKMIIAGGSAYPRKIDFAKFREIADKVGAILFADIAHYAGLIATKLYPSASKYADVMTTTTHKTLRGPRGGMIMSNNEDLFKKLNSAIFPGTQGGPIMNIITAKAVAFKEALQPEFKNYSRRVIKNCQIMGETLKKNGYDLVTGGTDCHLLLVDLTNKNISGKKAEKSLEKAGITCNKNTVPGETRSPFITSGIRIGSAVGTTRGFGEKEFTEIGNMISYVLDNLSSNPEDNSAAERDVLSKVHSLCSKYQIYPGLF